MPDWPLPARAGVLDGLREAIVATDEQGVIHYVNVAAERAPGLAARLARRAARS